MDNIVRIQSAWRAKSVRLTFDAARRWAGICEGCPFSRLSVYSRERLKEQIGIIFEGFPNLRYNHARKKLSYPPRKTSCNWGIHDSSV